jgi:hypothetical protein
MASAMFTGCIIKGKIVDKNGVGVAGVSVALSGAASMTTKTGSNGDYRFGTFSNILSAGNYVVTPSGFGYDSTPSTRNVTLTTLTLEGIGEVPGPFSDVDFRVDAVSCTSPPPNLIGIWDASHLESGSPIYFHFFDDCQMIIEFDMSTENSGQNTSEPIRIYGRYAWMDSEFIFSMYYATDKNLTHVDIDDDCWIYSPYFNTVTISNVYLSGNEFHVSAGGQVSLTPDNPPNCSDDNNMTVTTDLVWVVKRSSVPGNFLIN